MVSSTDLVRRWQLIYLPVSTDWYLCSYARLIWQESEEDRGREAIQSDSTNRETPAKA
ncbi:MAG: hypothetical protein ACI8TP_002211 [Acidimicrobiales bacterium]|jgi:hypothetical protein